MADPPRSRVEEVLALCRPLSPSEKQSLVDAIHAEIKGEVQDTSSNQLFEVVESHWITLDEAAESLRKSKSQVSCDAKKGLLRTNGKAGRHLRIFRPSVALANFYESRRYLRKSLREEDEDPEATFQCLCGWAEDHGIVMTARQKCRWLKRLHREGECYALIREFLRCADKMIPVVKDYVELLWDRHRPK